MKDWSKCAILTTWSCSSWRRSRIRSSRSMQKMASKSWVSTCFRRYAIRYLQITATIIHWARRRIWLDARGIILMYQNCRLIRTIRKWLTGAWWLHHPDSRETTVRWIIKRGDESQSGQQLATVSYPMMTLCGSCRSTLAVKTSAGATRRVQWRCTLIT